MTALHPSHPALSLPADPVTADRAPRSPVLPLIVCAFGLISVAAVGVWNPRELAIVSVLFNHIAIFGGLALVCLALAFGSSSVSWWTKGLVAALLVLPLGLAAPLALARAPLWHTDALIESPDGAFNLLVEQSVGTPTPVWQISIQETTPGWQAKSRVLGCVSDAATATRLASVTWSGNRTILLRSVTDAASFITVDQDGRRTSSSGFVTTPGLIGCP